MNFLISHSDIELNVLNTVGVRGKGFKSIFRFCHLLYRIFIFARKSDIITLHCSTTALHIIGIATFAISRLVNKPLIIRKFGGDDYRTTLGVVGRWITEVMLRNSDLYLAQTQGLTKQALDRGISNVSWYPTSRPAPEHTNAIPQKREKCLRFVYVGRVCETKGMCILAKIAGRLPEGVTISIYGHWHDDLERNIFDHCPNVQYHGILTPAEVIPTMRKYDASLLPSHYRGEGYPGAVLESYFAGLPVIATRWRALPEIIDESVGILVEPKNPDALLEAILQLVENRTLFQKLRSNTQTKAEFFSTEHWGKFFVECCRKIIYKKRKKLV